VALPAQDSAIVLFRELQAAQDALSFGGSYLAAPNVGLLGSSGDRALPLAATLLAWGRQGLAARIDADMSLAEQLADLVLAEPELELWRRPVTGVVTWRPRDPARRPRCTLTRSAGYRSMQFNAVSRAGGRSSQPRCSSRSPIV